ncbi:ribosomal protein L43, mitochondrial, putative [Plasmodium ovale curtisi]|uniref:Large ribosomal subunit protein mL43 n=1 Tax=Plasmodium ovale curtisi TaxID=864141 RepID=A0A1A8VTS1_PLAOA|nr:ribosomal protein L43, mitochondrial, putative [Plasmodium ovale curtisi]SBS87701.1 ribosomal protein L43, mitochondrial, putative [Plasmodium ovale curtisi]
MCSNGVYQLKKILLKYSETGHSSRNVRFFLRFILPDYKEENKHLNIEIQHEQYEEPLAIFEYINNSRYEISLKDIKSKHIVDIINLYKDSAGNSNFLKHGGPKVYSNKRSIQGLWCPSIYSELNAISYLKKKKKNNIKLPKYTRESLNLNHDVIRGNGRWGNENLFPKGFDQRYLKNVFCFPFRDSLPKGGGASTTCGANEAHINSFYRFYKK